VGPKGFYFDGADVTVYQPQKIQKTITEVRSWQGQYFIRTASHPFVVICRIPVDGLKQLDIVPVVRDNLNSGGVDAAIVNNVDTKEPYKCSGITNAEGRYFVEGPGNGFGYYAYTLWPEFASDTEDGAKRDARIANTAFREGYEQAQRDIRKALGIA